MHRLVSNGLKEITSTKEESITGSYDGWRYFSIFRKVVKSLNDT